MYASMKTISLDHPVRVYFKDGECWHPSATIFVANGFPSFVRGKNPDVIYPWENVKHVIRVADEPAEPDLTERLRASVAAIADERNGAKQNAMRLGTLLVSTVLRVAEALGRAAPDSRDPNTAVELARDISKLRGEANRLRNLHTEHRQALRAALGLRDDEANDNATGDFKALCERVASAAKQEDVAVRYLKADLDSVTEQRDVLKRQLEELRHDLADGADWRTTCAELEDGVAKVMRAAGLGSQVRGGDHGRLPARWVEELTAHVQPKQVEPGGPIWVRVVDTTSKHFGLVGRLVGIEHHTTKGECWGVDFPDLDGKDHAWNRAESFAVVGNGRQGPGPNEAPRPDAEHQQAQNRDKWRATCLANGAKDCTVFFGPGDGITFVVEMNQGTRKTISEIKEALMVEHCLPPTSYTIREVRPAFSGLNKGRD